MNKRLCYYIGCSVVIGGGIYASDKFNVSLPTVIQYYVNDFLIVPMVLFLSLYVIRKLKGDFQFRLTIAQILYVCCAYAIFFEYWLPKFHERYTADFIDVGLYFLSGVVFYFLQKGEE